MNAFDCCEHCRHVFRAVHGHAARCPKGCNATELTAEEAADTNRIQAENRDRLDAANDAEREDVLRWLNDFHPDVLRDAMNETGSNR